MENKKLSIIPCYYAFFANGMMVLVIGAILPYLMLEAGINYSTAGGFLSAFAIGNLLASFVNPPLVKVFGRRVTTVALTLLIPICLITITMVPPAVVIYAAFILLGIGRGTVSIVNNMVVNDSNGGAAALNVLHTMFAVGAFMAPFMVVLYIHIGLTWKWVIYTITLLTAISSIVYTMLPALDKKADVKKDKSKGTKMINFYIIGLVLFFYLGVENCVNGWFVTYFKSQGIMSDAYATNLVSVTWIMIMAGRLLTAALSKKMSKQKLILMNCIGTAIFFILLISTTQLAIITIAVVGLGLCFAGIYPTCVANAGEYIVGSTTGMSLLLAIAALGGIITPQIVGILADNIGMTMAISFLLVSIALMLVFAIVNAFKKAKA